MPVIGLTGNIGCGKSTISRYLADKGAYVIDADQISRDVVAPGAPALTEIVESFGREVLSSDGTLDRKKLGAVVFGDPQARATLNRIMHKRIMEEIDRLEQDFRKQPGSDRKLLVIDAPLLIEVGLNQGVDEIWVVRVDPEIQVTRLIERDGLNREEALKRIASQMPQEEKIKYARRVIDSSGPVAETRKQVDRHLADLNRIFNEQP